METLIIKVDEIPRVEWRNERVVTTTQLAEFYECSAKHIQQNYNNNVARFVEGKHFYRLEGDALRAFKHDFENFELAAPQLNLLYLWTKRGAARHAKMLNTDRAWEVFEALEDNYFNRPAVAVELETLAVEREKIVVEREKLALERDKFNVENSEETKLFKRAQLLRDIASSSKDDFLRDKLIREATKILIGDDFFEDISDDID